MIAAASTLRTQTRVQALKGFATIRLKGMSGSMQAPTAESSLKQEAADLSEATLRKLDHETLVQEVLTLQTRLKEERSRSTSSPSSAATAPEKIQQPRKRTKVEARQHDGGKKKVVSFAHRRLVALKIGYIGWMFDGFVQQPARENSVEARLLEAMRRTCLIAADDDFNSIDWSRGGRTDVGVSAVGNVIGVRLRSISSQLEEEMDYAKILNGVLPDGLFVFGWASAMEAGTEVEGRRMNQSGRPFSARHDALHRTYKYYFMQQGLDVDAMSQAAKAFVGRHDFRNFCRVDVNNNVTNFARVLLQVDVQPAAVCHALPTRRDMSLSPSTSVYEVTVRGQAFLWHQIRCMMAVLFEVGRGAEQPDVVEKMLAGGQGAEAFSAGKPSYRMASELPLVFYDCAFPPTVADFHRYEANPSMIIKAIESKLLDQWHRLTIKGKLSRHIHYPDVLSKLL